MFASGSKARVASLVAGAAAAIALVASPSAHALEGIQGRHAIFYPSLELVYQHDDNFTLARNNEISADTFIAHAHFALEVPGSRQYLRLEYEPQWRNIDINDNSTPDPLEGDDISHFWHLDATLRGSSLFSADIHHDFTLGVLESDALDANRGELVRTQEQFWANDIGVDFKWEGNRQGAVIKVGHYDTEFDEIEKAPSWFEISELRFGAEYFYKFTPLTKFLVGYAFTDSGQDYTPRATAAGFPDTFDSQSNEVYFGFNGELGRTTTGAARLGFVALDYDSTLALGNQDFDGITLAADVTKSFSRYSKLIFGAERAVNYSGYVEGDGGGLNPDWVNTFYVSNRVGFTFSNQPQGARVGWTIAGAFQRNGYDTPTPSDVAAPGTGPYEREDDITHLRAEVGFHPLEHLSFRLNYRWEERESNHNEWEYTDNIIIFQVQFGF